MEGKKQAFLLVAIRRLVDRKRIHLIGVQLGAYSMGGHHLKISFHTGGEALHSSFGRGCQDALVSVSESDQAERKLR